MSRVCLFLRLERGSIAIYWLRSIKFSVEFYVLLPDGKLPLAAAMRVERRRIDSMTAKKADVEAKSAWLVTWDGTSSVPDDPIAAILSYRLSASSVKAFVELLYASLSYSPREKLIFAKAPKTNPYPATITLFQHIHCGDNPHLHARLVSHLKVTDGVLTWTEPPSEPERQARISR
jgi:hypothetical protein